eukprot:5287117-Pyramimonas_sp.AAC.1
MARMACSGALPSRMRTRTCVSACVPSSCPRKTAQCSKRAPERPGPEWRGYFPRLAVAFSAASASQGAAGCAEGGGGWRAAGASGNRAAKSRATSGPCASLPGPAAVGALLGWPWGPLG